MGMFTSPNAIDPFHNDFIFTHPLRSSYSFLVTTNISKSSVVSFLSRLQFPSSAAYISISENHF